MHYWWQVCTRKEPFWCTAAKITGSVRKHHLTAWWLHRWRLKPLLMHLKAPNAVGLYRTHNFQILLENRNWMEKLTCELALHLWPWSRVALGPVAWCGRILHTALVLLLKARPGAAGATAGKDLQHLLPRQSLLPHEQFEGFSNLSQTLGG